jgi:hypothetical protein
MSPQTLQLIVLVISAACALSTHAEIVFEASNGLTTFVTDANMTRVITAANRTVEANEWDLITLFLFISSDPLSVDGSLISASAAVDAHAKLSALATAVRLYDASGNLAEHIQFLWGICGAHPGDDKSSCGIAQHYGLDINTLPTLIVLGSDGNRAETWEKLHLLRQPPLHVAAHLASHAHPVVRRVYSVSDVTALPAALVEEHDASGQSLKPRSIVLSSSAPRTEAQDAAVRVLAANLRGVAAVYVMNGPQPYKELHAMTENVSADCASLTPSGEDGGVMLTIIRLHHTSLVNKGTGPEADGCSATPLLRSAAQRVSARSKKNLFVTTQRLPESLLVQLSDAVNQSALFHDQVRHASVVALLDRVTPLLFDDVEHANPLHRDVLLSRAPACTIVHFIPNLFNTTTAASPPLGGAVNHHVNYYTSRHRKLVNSLATPASSSNGLAAPHRCAVTLVDPQGSDKDLFLSLGFKHSDVFQTSATIRDAQGKSFSGKSRDNLIVLIIHNTYRFKFAGAYYDAADVERFVREEVALVAASRRNARVAEAGEGFRKTLVMRSALFQIGSSASLSPTVSGTSAVFPWCYVPIAGSDALQSRRTWELEAPKWLTSATYDTFDKLVLGDMSRDTVLIVVPSVSNATVRGNTSSPSLRLEAAVGQLVAWVASRHPSTHGALRFARLALDENNVPRILIPHVPLAPLPLAPPYMFYISRNSKIEMMSDGRSRNSVSSMPSHRPQILETIKLTAAERNAAKVVRIPLSLSKSALPLSAVRDELRDALQSVSPLQWVFDTRYVEGSDGVKEQGSPAFDERGGFVADDQGLQPVIEDGAWEGEENEF